MVVNLYELKFVHEPVVYCEFVKSARAGFEPWTNGVVQTICWLFEANDIHLKSSEPVI